MNNSRNLICAALLALLSLSDDAQAGPTLGGCPVFPGNNYWNTPVDGLPLHASSAAWVNSIGASTRLHPDWGNVLADNYGIPFVTVTGAQPNVPITFDPNGYDDESDPGPFPIPPNAPIEGGSASDGDRHVIVVETSHCMLYELYYAFPVGTATFTFADVSNGTFAYSVNGVAQSKAITREVFATPATACN